jgi:four helix bundle protein
LVPGVTARVTHSPADMGVNRFEDLRVWQLAKAFSDEIGGLIQQPPVARDIALSRQLNAAALSVVANIAEGFVHGGRKEFAQYVRIAAASNAEARRHVDEVSYDHLVQMTESIGRMLRVLEKRLRDK